MENFDLDSERRNDYQDIKGSLSDIKKAMDKILTWKEDVIIRLIKIEERFSSFIDWKTGKHEECDSCRSRIKKLEDNLVISGREFVKSNIFFEAVKYVFIALVGAVATWFLSKR